MYWYVTLSFWLLCIIFNNIHNVQTDTQQQRSLTQSHKAGFRTALRDLINLHCLVIQFLVGAAFARDRSSASTHGLFSNIISSRSNFQ